MNGPKKLLFVRMYGSTITGVLVLLLLGCVFVLLVRAKSFRKKNKEFKTALITSFTLLLVLFSKEKYC